MLVFKCIICFVYIKNNMVYVVFDFIIILIYFVIYLWINWYEVLFLEDMLFLIVLWNSVGSLVFLDGFGVWLMWECVGGELCFLIFLSKEILIKCDLEFNVNFLLYI